ncbi:hypothetical protein PIB30_060182 [Stylosanthes scabra]|uniref:Uncharacterized protein n=1 Tax=Stylosanthes scabra TaxID=79078 RepID=A0ABU6SLT7_9FABA|nr:hypothetical protein [Stylosanthes scabra]
MTTQPSKDVLALIGTVYIMTSLDVQLRLTHRLRLHEACSVLFDSIPLGSMLWGMISEAYELATLVTIDGVCASSACV